MMHYKKNTCLLPGIVLLKFERSLGHNKVGRVKNGYKFPHAREQAVLYRYQLPVVLHYY